MSNVYPTNVLERLGRPLNAGKIDNANAIGKAASLECGTFVSFEISVDYETKLIQKIAFRSNGCGFMVGSADVLAGEFEGRHLTDLHAVTGIHDTSLSGKLGKLPAERQHCVETAIAAFKEALADFRRRQVEEFAGEKALICTCFGITEETIELAVSDGTAKTVEEVGRICRAGTGCGSCQMMIREIIDSIGGRD